MQIMIVMCVMFPQILYDIVLYATLQYLSSFLRSSTFINYVSSSWSQNVTWTDE